MIYEIAEKKIDIRNRYGYTTKFCAAYLAEDQTAPCDLTVEVSEEELLKEKELSPDYAKGYLENLAIYRKICYAFTAWDRFLFHGTVLEYGGNAYLFSGKSGSGKTTHTSLWLKHIAGCKILNGDKPILRVTEKGITAYGTPWNGKEGIGYNGKAMVKAICFIRQAKKNAITKVEEAHKATCLLGQILIPPDEEGVVKTMEFADELTKLDIYVLDCDISEEAVKTSFEQLTGKEYKGA